MFCFFENNRSYLLCVLESSGNFFGGQRAGLWLSCCISMVRRARMLGN
jgi:hypothetical protein